MPIQVKTLPERKAEAVARLREAVTVLRHELAEAAPGLGGRYILYGSAARGELRYDSDVDILLDFPDAMLPRAYDVVESLCARLAVKGDLAPVKYCTDAFLAHVLRDADILG